MEIYYTDDVFFPLSIRHATPSHVRNINLPLPMQIPSHSIGFQSALIVLYGILAVCFSFGYAQATIPFSNVSAQTGIRFQHDDGSLGKYYIVETMSAGLALFDYDVDGDIDIYFLNGCPRQKGELASRRPRNALFRNDGNWKFTDVTEFAGVGDRAHGLGVAIGDYDNDGNPDIYVNNDGPNVLYHNQGDGTFVDQTEFAKVGNGQRVGAGVSFLDIDNDGHLDLYVANYVKFSPDIHVPRTQQGFPIYGSPVDYHPEPDSLFRNRGDGTFEDVSMPSGIALVAAPGMGMVCSDYDQDGDTDVLVANDGVANFLFQNNGEGRFKEVGLLTGFAYDASGKTHASMGVDAGDFNNDGLIDFHVTSYQGEIATLYKNIRGGFLEDVTNRVGAGIGTRNPVTWGNGFADFDNDGDRDIFVACGHLNDLLHKFDQTTTYKTPNVVLENSGGNSFTNVSSQCGPGLRVKASSRGAGFGDLDNDGDLDAVILNNRGAPTLLRNDTDAKNNWIQIRLRGIRNNRDGIGSLVAVETKNTKQFAEVHSGRGYQSHFGSRLHFGMGAESRIATIRVKWLNGKEDIIKNIKANQRITIIEGQARNSR